MVVSIFVYFTELFNHNYSGNKVFFISFLKYFNVSDETCFQASSLFVHPEITSLDNVFVFVV